MASNVTRDHHNLRRNLKLNSNYISNDGGDEGLSIDNDGVVTASGKIIIDKNYTDTTAVGDMKGFHVDIDRTGTVSSGSDLVTGIDLDVTHTGASGGTIISRGLDIDIVGDSGGTSSAFGVMIDVSGVDAANSNGIYINNINGGTDFKNISSADSSDYFTINTIANGATTLSTVDNGGTDADITISADGVMKIQGNSKTTIGSYIEFDQNGSGAAGASMKFMSIADTGDYFMIDTATLGATTISTVDSANNEAAHLTFDIQGDTIFKGDIADGTSTEVARIDSSASSLLIGSSKKIELGAAEEYIYGDGTDIHIGVGSAGDINIPVSIGLTFGADTEKIEGTGSNNLEIDAAGDIVLDAEGDILLNANGGNISTGDGLSAYVPTNGNDVTNKAYVDSVMYDNRVCNYATTSASTQYVPLAGYVLEGITASSNEFRAMIMPYDGSLIRIIWRSEVEQTSGNFSIIMLIASDGTESPATKNFQTRVTSFTLAANTTYVHDPGVTQAYDATGNETNAFSKGQIIAVGIDPTVAPNDTNCTLVFKYDTST